MPDRPRATDGSDEQEAGSGYFAPLASARYLRLTTFKHDGTPESASVLGVADGDLAYFRVPHRSAVAKRLRRIAVVQVTPCGVLGFCIYGPPLDAIARLLPDDEASQVAAELARRRPARHRFLTPLFRRRADYYQLTAGNVADVHSGLPDRAATSLTTTVHASQVVMQAGAATPTSLATVCTPATSSRGRPSSTRVITVSMSLAGAQASRSSW